MPLSVCFQFRQLPKGATFFATNYLLVQRLHSLLEPKTHSALIRIIFWRLEQNTTINPNN